MSINYSYIAIIGSIKDLRALPAGQPGDLVKVLGWTVPGDGGGGDFYWSGDSRDDGGLYIAGWNRLWDCLQCDPAWWGWQTTTEQPTDAIMSQNVYALKRAVHAITGDVLAPGNRAIGCTILLRSGYVNASTRIDRCVSAIGSSGGSSGAGTVIQAPLSCGVQSVFEVYRGRLPDGTEDPASGDGSYFANFELWGGAGVAEFNPAINGMTIHATCTLENLYIQAFAGDGIYIQSSVVEGTSASSSMLRDLLISGCGQGLHVGEGGDSNAMLFQNVRVLSCKRWNFIDEAFIANTYIAASSHDGGTEDRTLYGAYCSTQGTAAHTYLSCYIETGQICSFAAPVMIIGGGLAYVKDAMSERPAINGVMIEPAIISVNMNQRVGEDNYNSTVGVAAELGSTVRNPNDALCFGTYNLGSYMDSCAIHWEARPENYLYRTWKFVFDRSDTGHALALVSPLNPLWQDVNPCSKAVLPHGWYGGEGPTSQYYSPVNCNPSLRSFTSWKRGYIGFNYAPDPMVSSPAAWVCSVPQIGYGSATIASVNQEIQARVYSDDKPQWIPTNAQLAFQTRLDVYATDPGYAGCDHWTWSIALNAWVKVGSISL